MKKTITLITATLLIMSIAHATVWRVNNRNNVDADFTTLQDAIDGASANDTLYIEASPTAYGDGIFSKKLTVLGAGFWLEENDTTQAYKEYSRVGRLTFSTGSEGSKLQGLFIYHADAGNFYLLRINTDNISIERNYIYGYKQNGNATGYCVYINSNVSDIVIKQNWINARIHYTANYVGSIMGIHFEGTPENTLIQSNFIRAYKTSSYGGFFAVHMGSNSVGTELIVSGNVMWGALTTYYTFHYDNILVSGSYNNPTSDQTFNNLCDGTQYPNVNNNQQNVDMTTVFVDHDLYIDNGYILATGSPAIGAGISGADCGVFNDYPYILSGIPEIPAIFDAHIVPIGTSSLPVNIKTKSNN